MTIRLCADCGKTRVTGHALRKRCVKCERAVTRRRQAAYRARHHTQRPMALVCVDCHRPVTSKNGRRVRCRTCHTEYARARNRVYMAAYRGKLRKARAQ